MEAKERIKKHRTQSVHYFENALYFIDAGDIEKASEFLWGSLTQALKALAASKGMQLRSHRDIREYTMELAKALKDESIKNAFIGAESLHSNFYESGLTLEDLSIRIPDVKSAVAKILSLVPASEPGK